MGEASPVEFVWNDRTAQNQPMESDIRLLLQNSRQNECAEAMSDDRYSIRASTKLVPQQSSESRHRPPAEPLEGQQKSNGIKEFIPNRASADLGISFQNRSDVLCPLTLCPNPMEQQHYVGSAWHGLGQFAEGWIVTRRRTPSVSSSEGAQPPLRRPLC